MQLFAQRRLHSCSSVPLHLLCLDNKEKKKFAPFRQPQLLTVQCASVQARVRGVK
jgi:hypothetical protein